MKMLELIIYGFYGLLTLGSIFIAYKLMYAFKHFTMKRLVSEPSMLHDLPSVSVCIPARNETHAMTQCLERVVASTYPKLEIIVLDDSSADNTSILIKSFAHAGVRFVEGTTLPDGWLGKNHALQGLLDEASGSLILYMDVDTHIAPDTIEQLVSYMGQEKAAMISVLPRRSDGIRWSVLLSSLRYFWELMRHRRHAPASASSAWMINRKLLIESMGGFSSIRADIQPEATIAARLNKFATYRFLIGTDLLGVSFEKKWRSQVDTSIRLLFPVLGSRLWRALLVMLLLLLLNIPAVTIIAAIFDGWTLTQTMALWQLCVYAALYALYLDKVWSKAWWVGALLWPVIVAQELVLVFISTTRYLRKAVTWKGRPITSR